MKWLQRVTLDSEVNIGDRHAPELKWAPYVLRIAKNMQLTQMLYCLILH